VAERSDGGGPWMGSVGLSMGFPFFVFFILLTKAGRSTALVKAQLTMTFCPRRLRKPPRLSHFARLG
jgi:hypothetical protein